MAKVIRTIIDEDANISTDFSGFVGDECQVEEERLRQALASLGLVLHVSDKKRKAVESENSATVNQIIRQ